MSTTPSTVVKSSIDGGSTQGEDKVSKLPYYRIDNGEDRPVAVQGSGARQLVGATATC